jgi:hypothetical protein
VTLVKNSVRHLVLHLGKDLVRHLVQRAHSRFVASLAFLACEALVLADTASV